MRLIDKIRPTKALLRLLEREHNAILRSDFSLVAELSATKETLMRALRHESAEGRDLNNIRALAARNARLLGASARGLKSARERLSQLNSLPTETQTYGPGGLRMTLDNRRPGLGRKA